MGLQPTVQPMHTCGCQPLINAYLYQLYLRNHWVTLHLLVSSLKCSLSFLGLLTESLDQTRLMVAPPTVHLMLAGLHQTFGCPTLRASYVGYLYLQNHWLWRRVWPSSLQCSPIYSSAYVCKLYVQNHCVTLHLWKRNLKCSLCWVTSTYRITGLHFSYGSATLKRAYVGYP